MPYQRHGIAGLVVFSCKRIRHKYYRLTCYAQLGYSKGACPGYHNICGSIGIVHFFYKISHFYISTGRFCSF